MATYLPWIILLPPLLAAAFIVCCIQSFKGLSAAISVCAVLVSFVASGIAFFHSDFTVQVNWLDFGDTLQVPIGFTIDQLSKVMLFVVTFVGALIHIYSLGYMAEDEGKSRYFAGLSLFMFSMLGIVLANNFVMMFIFWELVGVSSYILIGHWFNKPAPPAAANKAFITNRIGDFGFMLGILMLWLATGSVAFPAIAEKVHAGAIAPAYLTIATLLVFCGAIGKSAQFPLHVWLPDAMEGPTPVSALIHAATMVAAGVYMLARSFFLIEAAPDAQTVIAWIGTITMVLAALMATQQNDIKRILAYSTLSQLGYMVMAIGVGSSEAAMFHLFNHAFFKALLFLGAGAIIHSLHHEQNIWKMGALKNAMPTTFLTFLAGTLALTGCPFLSGSFSKDAILAAAQERSHWIYALGLMSAFLTAFYMFRLFVVVFLGRSKADHARHGHEVPGVMTMPLVILSLFAVFSGYHFFAGRFLALPHEQHPFMVQVLAFAAFASGSLLAIMLYSGKSQDPVHIPFLANKFYFDEIYAVVIRFTQDLLAGISGAFDRWVLDGAVQVAAGATRGIGFVLSFLQIGNLQGYSFLFGVGVVALIYYMVFQ